MLDTTSSRMGIRNRLRRYLSDQYPRDEFVIAELSRLEKGSLLLDAGAGSQRYRKSCTHLQYHAQDFGEYSVDRSPGFASNVGSDVAYQYGQLDYVGDIWRIQERDEHFDAILCTEVLEHIPYPIEAIKEFARLLKRGGRLILTAPSNCLRHMDPYYFYSGFSDRFFERVLSEHGFAINTITPIGDYYSWMCVEIARTAALHSFWAKIILVPTFVWYSRKKRTQSSVNTLCKGYHVVATKK